MLWRWWAASTNSDFLRSWGSRRSAGRVVWPAFIFFSVLFDVSTGIAGIPGLNDTPINGTTVLDVVFLASIYAILTVDLGSLLYDGIIWANIVIYCLLYVLFNGVQTHGAYECGFVVMMVLTGVHTSCIAAAVSVLDAFFLILAYRSLGTFFIIGFLSVGMNAYFEFVGSALFRTLREEQFAKDQLLDNATDGFCTIEVTHGRITAASEKLRKTLGVHRLEGCSFSTFLRGADHEKFHALSQDAIENSMVSPILVTCVLCKTIAVERDRLPSLREETPNDEEAFANIEAAYMASEVGVLPEMVHRYQAQRRGQTWTEFDARLVPFAVPGNNLLSFCVQTLGEVREVTQSADPGLAAATDAASARRPARASGGWRGSPHPADKEWDRDSLAYSDTTAHTGLQQPTRRPESEVSFNVTVKSLPHPGTCEVGVQTDDAASWKLPPVLPGRRQRWGSSGGSAKSDFVPRSRGSRSHRPASNSPRSPSSLLRSTSDSRSSSSDSSTVFKVTLAKSRQASILWILKHWNLERTGGCCPLHSYLAELRGTVNKMRNNAQCQPLWSSLTGWQCAVCTCMNPPSSSHCDICTTPKSRPDSNPGCASTALAELSNVHAASEFSGGPARVERTGGDTPVPVEPGGE